MSRHVCAECQGPTTNPKFCSRSCSAKFTNRIKSRKHPVKYCKCGEAIWFSKVYCKECWAEIVANKPKAKPRNPNPKSVRKPRLDKTKCIDCEVQLDDTNSYIQGNAFYPYCKPCHVVRCLKKQTKFKEDCVDYKGGCCVYCGYNTYYPSLVFHHLDPSKKEFNPSKYSKQKLDDVVKNELDGCVLICANCHAEAHSQRSFNREIHKYVRNLSDFIIINSVDHKLDWWSIIKIDYVNYLNNKCMKCGYQRNLAALQFHHRDPTKKDFTIASANKMPFEEMKSELDKCDLLCANCHGEHHHSSYLNTINRHYQTLADFIKT